MVPTTRLLQPTIYTYDTLDDKSCTTQRPSHLRLSPTPNHQRSPSGYGTGNASCSKWVDMGKRGQHLLPCPAHVPQRFISAPSSPLNKSTNHLIPHHKYLHCFHSNHSDDDSSDSCAIGSPIRHVFATRPHLNSHSYVNRCFPTKGHNGNVKQLVTTEPAVLCCPRLIGYCFIFSVSCFVVVLLHVVAFSPHACTWSPCHIGTLMAEGRNIVLYFVMSQRLIATLFNVGKLVVNKYVAELINNLL